MLIATRNRHKVGEIRAILGGSFQFLTLNDFPDAPKVVEDAPTFAGNATKKAVELAKWMAAKHPTSNIQHPTSNFVLADDSGLEVDALDGAPGVHSARFAALDSAKSGNTSDADNNAKLLRLLKDFRRKNAPRGFVASSHWCKSKAHSPQSTVHSYSTAPAKAGLVSRRAGRTASATTRCSCRTVSSRRLPNWART